jgi:hypothetical protein
MVTIKDIEVLDLFSTQFLHVKFTINDTSEDITEYSFNLYKANSPEDAFVLIAPNITDFVYSDYDVNLYNPAISYYYKVEIVDKNGIKTISDKMGAYRGRQPDAVAETIVYNYNTYLKNIINNQMHLLQRKHNGQLCTHCYDKIRRRASDSNCPFCYATKYIGGYYPPTQIYVSLLNSASIVNEFTISSDTEEVSPIQLWTSNFPIIKVQDVLIDRNNDRFIVTNWQPTYKDYYIIRQLIQIQRIPKSDVVYTFPIPIE